MAIRYWNNKHELACRQWLSASTQQEQTRIYNVLIGGMRELVENIMHRYYTISDARRIEVREEVITHIFCNLNKYNPERQKAYTFCGTVARNKVYEVVVSPITKNKKKVDIQLLDDDFDYVMEDAEPLVYENTYVEFDVQEVCAILNKKIKEILIIIDKRRKSIKKKKHKHYSPEYIYDNHKITILQYMIEYISKYEDLNPYNMVDYAHNDLLKQGKEFDKRYIARWMRDIFPNFGLPVYKREKSLMEEKYKSEDWTLDDTTPDRLESEVRAKRKQLLQRIENK